MAGRRNVAGKRGAKPAPQSARRKPADGMRDVRNKARTRMNEARRMANQNGRVETYPTSKNGDTGTRLSAYAQLELEWWRNWHRAQKDLGENVDAVERPPSLATVVDMMNRKQG